MSELENKPLNYGNLERFYKDLLKNDLKELKEKIKENKGIQYTAGENILINGTEISAIIPEIEASSTPIVDLTTDSNISFNIDPNKMYMFGERTTLTITFNAGDSTVVNEYMFLFISGSTATTLNVPSTVIWMKDPDILTDKKYMVSIENNLGVIGEWSNE